MWRKFPKRALIRALVVIALVWVLGCGALYRIMRQPPEQFGHFMAKLPGPVPFLLFPFETLWMQARAGACASCDLSTRLLVDEARKERLGAALCFDGAKGIRWC